MAPEIAPEIEAINVAMDRIDWATKKIIDIARELAPTLNNAELTTALAVLAMLETDARQLVAESVRDWLKSIRPVGKVLPC